MSALEGLATNARRRELAAETKRTLDHLAKTGLLDGLVAVEIFGSFVSEAERPHDVDLLLHYNDLDADTARLVDEHYGSSHRGPVTIVPVDAGPEGDAFRHEYRTETMRRYGVATVRIV